jgi:MoxR-like ATPase
VTISTKVTAIYRRLLGRRPAAAIPTVAVGSPIFQDHMLQTLQCVPEPLRAPLMSVVQSARIVGVAEERARLAEIMELPGAHEFGDLAWTLAKAGDCTPAQAARVLARASFQTANAVMAAAALAERDAAAPIIH